MTEEQNESADRWVTFSPDIKVLDCTIRDGGLVNDHKFDDDFVRRIFSTAVEAGVDYVEVGYKADKKIFSPSDYGPWKFSDEDDLRRIVDTQGKDVKVAVIADVERTNYREDILPKDQSVIDTVRVACYIHQIPAAMEMVQDAHDKGYETLLQLMAISVVNEDDLKVALDVGAKSPVSGIYIVDSFGALYSEQVRKLTQIYKTALDGTGKEIGFHAHNNLQLGFANTIEALINGATRLDATINGLGRGAGNCPLELLLGFLHNPKYKQRPVLDCITDIFVPMRDKLDWGYSIPYSVTGRMNQHPRDAIKWRAGETPDDYVTFYDQMMEGTS
ncbi:MAG: 4-hydroxy 2-oxovalerate aldolase [Candidatus Promineifilaceae bacterium]|jgi:4-hydroxy 2-oxovalerate aldolase